MPVKAKALRAGSLLAIVSPAGAPVAEKVYAGMAALAGLGYRTRLMPHALCRGRLYFAGTVAERVADLHAAFADAEVDGIVCTRGGWGSAELLPHLDAGLVQANRKVFVGYSDITSLHVWLLEQAGLVSFQGPMVAADFSKATGADSASWRAALEGAAAWELDGLRVLRAGRAEGMLTGGCLSIYAESLGTPFAARAHGGVLFLEDVGTKPYQWDRMLLHLRLAGLLEGVQGIVFGDMAQCVEPAQQAQLEGSLLHALADFSGPVAIGLRSGHVDAGNITLPFGVRVELDCTDERNPRMHFHEAAVTP